MRAETLGCKISWSKRQIWSLKRKENLVFVFQELNLALEFVGYEFFIKENPDLSLLCLIRHEKQQ